MKQIDARHMRGALALAQRGIGQVSPNPSVGCVIVDFSRCENGEIVGRGRTGPGGRPHAEAVALKEAGERARGATAFVSLEPCAHHGETPPCAKSLIEAGVKRVVGALADPDERVAGKGYDMLESSGVEVVRKCLSDEAKAVNEGFFKRIEKGRPHITAKMATSIDGRIATHSGDSKWITGEPARRRGHLERARHDAILVGSTTATIDDPGLDCRLPGLEWASPERVVVDSRLRLPLTSKLIATAAEKPTTVFTLSDVDPARQKAFEDCGVRVLHVPVGYAGLPDVGEIARSLANLGVTRLLVEGGGRIIASFIQAGLIDRLLSFRSNSVMGGDGLPGLAAMGIDRVVDAPTFHREAIEVLGKDVVEVFEREN